VRYLRAVDRSRPVAGWVCYHSIMDRFDHCSREYGIVGGAVGASYAVLVAEQLFASGCHLLLSITSSGQITTLGPTPYFILIERALRDEGTSYHYLPPDSEYAEADPGLLAIAERALASQRRRSGGAWGDLDDRRALSGDAPGGAGRGDSSCRNGGGCPLRIR
jgi:hypothetical protein